MNTENKIWRRNKSGFEIINPLEGATKTEWAEHAHDFWKRMLYTLSLSFIVTCQNNAHAGGKQIDEMVLQERLQLVRATLDKFWLDFMTKKNTNYQGLRNQVRILNILWSYIHVDVASIRILFWLQNNVLPAILRLRSPWNYDCSMFQKNYEKWKAFWSLKMNITCNRKWECCILSLCFQLQALCWKKSRAGSIEKSD